MQNFQPIEYHLTRDFSRKMNATFEFIRQNWKSLGKASLFIAGPPVLIASLIMGSFMGDLFDFTGAAPERSLEMLTSTTFWLEMCLAMVLFLLSSVMSLATINNYIILYEELKTPDIPTSVVWERVRITFWLYLRTTIYFFFTFLALGVVMTIPIGILSAVSPVMVVLGVWALFVGFFYLLFSVSLTYIIRAYEGLGFFESLTRSFKLIRGKWWSTFGLIFILYLIMMMVSYIPIIPLYVVMAVTAFHNVTADAEANPFQNMGTTMMVFMAVYYMIQIILAALPNIGIAFQYFNLVEMKEAKWLMSNIENFGESSPARQNDETY
jgi:hypothetical protein